LRNVLFRFTGVDLERATQDFNEREERCLLSIGRAASYEDKRAVVASALTEFMNKPRLAHAGLGYQINDTKLRAGVVESTLQFL